MLYPHGKLGLRPSSMKHFFAAAALVALLLFLITRNVSRDPYIYDEADYMYAASLGYFANWTDTPSLSLSEFLRIGLGSAGRQDLSEFIRKSNDVVFYRHWHGPLYHFILIPVSRLGLNEHDVRLAMLAIPVLTVVALYFGCLWLIPGPRGSVIALLASVLFLSSFSVFGSNELAPHQLFALWCLCCLMFLAKTVATGYRAYWYAAIVMAALAFCTLEVGFVTVATLAICGYIERRRLKMDLRFITKSLALFILTILLVWPAAIFKLTFVKSYLFMAFLAVVRENSWGDRGFIAVWRSRLFSSPIEWLMLAFALIVFARRASWKENRIAYPMLIFSLLMLAATARVLSETSRYSLPFMPALDLFSAISIASLYPALRRPAVFGLAGLIFAAGVFEASQQPSKTSSRPASILQYIRQNHLTDKTLLVAQSDLPMIHYYFPATKLRGYYTSRPSPADFERFTPDAVLYP
jgi:hypothetical protein